AFIDPTPGSALVLDAQGLPVAGGTRTAPFRVVVPAGTGDYPFLMYLHGTRGTYEDTTLDTENAGRRGAKGSNQLDGWTQADATPTFIGFTEVFQGTPHAVAMLMQALADGAAIQKEMGSGISDLLSAPMLGGAPNPAAGRLPQSKTVLWTGGSLG